MLSRNKDIYPPPPSILRLSANKPRNTTPGGPMSPPAPKRTPFQPRSGRSPVPSPQSLAPQSPAMIRIRPRMSANSFDSNPDLYDIPAQAPGPPGSLPFTPEMLRDRPSGDLFGWTQNAGMGWKADALGSKEYLVLSTHGGVRAPDGSPIALGYHTGHWEVGLLVETAARTIAAAGRIPFAAACTD